MLDRHGVLRAPRNTQDVIAEAQDPAELDQQRTDPAITMRLDLSKVRDWTEAGMSWEEMEPRVRRMLRGEPT